MVSISDDAAKHLILQSTALVNVYLAQLTYLFRFIKMKIIKVFNYSGNCEHLMIIIIIIIKEQLGNDFVEGI